MEVVIGEESLTPLPLVVVAVVVAVVVTLDAIETETERGTGTGTGIGISIEMILEFLLQDGTNPLHLEVEVEAEGVVEVIGVHDRDPVHGALREGETVTIDSYMYLL